MYNYCTSSWGTTFILIWIWISEWRFKITLNKPIDFISLTGCINEGFMSIFSKSFIILEISVGLTDP